MADFQWDFIIFDIIKRKYKPKWPTYLCIKSTESRTEIGIIKLIKLRRAFIQFFCESTGTKLVFFLHQTWENTA